MWIKKNDILAYNYNNYSEKEGDVHITFQVKVYYLGNDVWDWSLFDAMIKGLSVVQFSWQLMRY